ncbi:MAG: hypothetical protein JNL68_19120 [Burkholderiales bacterium]|nr:hypothetical protein [Burkholderiales bacterium]
MDVQTATAVTTAAVAVLVAVITWRQWVTNRARLKHELFDRRYAIFEKITGFLAGVLQSGRVASGHEEQFLRDTKQAFFVFDCDPSIKTLVSDIYEHAVHLHALDAELAGLSGLARSENIQEQREIKDWYQTQLGTIESQFERYLRLGH